MFYTIFYWVYIYIYNHYYMNSPFLGCFSPPTNYILFIVQKEITFFPSVVCLLVYIWNGSEIVFCSTHAKIIILPLCVIYTMYSINTCRGLFKILLLYLATYFCMCLNLDFHALLFKCGDVCCKTKDSCICPRFSTFKSV